MKTLSCCAAVAVLMSGLSVASAERNLSAPPTAGVNAWAKANPKDPRLPAVQAKMAASAGRYQVVNATPQFRGMTMLLDTASGDSWLVCGKEGLAWCRLRFSELEVGPTNEAAPDEAASPGHQ